MTRYPNEKENGRGEELSNVHEAIMRSGLDCPYKGYPEISKDHPYRG